MLTTHNADVAVAGSTLLYFGDVVRVPAVGDARERRTSAVAVELPIYLPVGVLGRAEYNNKQEVLKGYQPKVYCICCCSNYFQITDMSKCHSYVYDMSYWVSCMSFPLK